MNNTITTAAAALVLLFGGVTTTYLYHGPLNDGTTVRVLEAGTNSWRVVSRVTHPNSFAVDVVIAPDVNGNNTPDYQEASLVVQVSDIITHLSHDGGLVQPFLLWKVGTVETPVAWLTEMDNGQVSNDIVSHQSHWSTPVVIPYASTGQLIVRIPQPSTSFDSTVEIGGRTLVR